MNRFIVHPLLWHDDIRTDQAVVFTQPRSFFTVDRLLSARDTHQTEFHQYDLVT